MFSDRDDGIRITRIGSKGELLAFDVVRGVFSDDDFDVGSVEADGPDLRVAWNTRRPGPMSPNALWLTTLDSELQPVERAQIAAEVNLKAGLLWPQGRPEFLVAAHYGVGLLLMDLNGRVRKTVEAAFWSGAVPEEGGRRLGLVLQTGKRIEPPSTGLPTGVSFQAWDPDQDRLSKPLVLQGDDGRCVEAAAAAAAGDEAGVAWAMGCSERRLYFARLRAR